MKYIKTKDGNIYEVVHENVGTDTYHYVCSTLYGYNITVKCGDDEKHMDDCHSIAFVDKGDVVKETENLEELFDGFVCVKKSDECQLFCQSALRDQLDCCDVYAIVRATGVGGEPVFNTVAKMNDKGQLELL